MVETDKVILVVTIILLVVMIMTLYFAWVASSPFIPACPPCPKIDTNALYSKEVENLKEMVNYLILVIKKYDAEKELYKLSNGYHQVYNSPKLDSIQREIARIKDKVKKDPTALDFFEKNLTNILD